jgi:hypothetical protein
MRDEESAHDATWVGCDEDNKLEQAPEVSVPKVSLTSPENDGGTDEWWNCVLEDCLSMLLLLSNRDRFVEPRRSFALDNAENNRFLPFVHERWCLV